MFRTTKENYIMSGQLMNQLVPLARYHQQNEEVEVVRRLHWNLKDMMTKMHLSFMGTENQVYEVAGEDLETIDKSLLKKFKKAIAKNKDKQPRQRFTRKFTNTTSDKPTNIKKLTCYKCGKRGHLARDCRSKGKKTFADKED